MCPCGQPVLARGLCRSCYDRQRMERIRFGGQRSGVVARDGGRCSGCESAGPLVVHHRSPGNNDPAMLVTLCIECHVRAHKSRRLPGAVPALLVTLWAEQHPDEPLQLQLDLV